MWDRKHQMIAVAVVLVVLSLIVAGLQGDGTTEERMLDAFDDHEHEAAFVLANEVLKSDPSNPNARRVADQSGSILLNLLSAKDALTPFRTLKDGASVSPGDLYNGLETARAHAATAIEQDKEFDIAESLGEKLDEAQTTLVYILAVRIMEVGDAAVGRAQATFSKTSDIVDSAESSPYLRVLLPVQSAWATVTRPVTATREELEPEIAEMDKMVELVSNYGKGAPGKAVKVMLGYIDAVKNTIDGLLYPDGNYLQFMEQAKARLKKYNNAKNRLEDRIPGSASSSETYSRLVEDLIDFRIFEDPATEVLVREQL